MMANNDLGGTSAKNVMHWSQMIRSGNLSFFDYGYDGNMRHYNQQQAPHYDVKTLSSRLSTVPLQLFVGDNDVLVPTHNLQKLLELLPKNDKATTHVNLTHLRDYNHLDLIWGSEQDQLVNTPIIKFVKSIDKIKLPKSFKEE